MRQKNGGRKMKEANAIFKEGNKRRRHSVKKCGSKRWGENRIFYMRKPRKLRNPNCFTRIARIYTNMRLGLSREEAELRAKCADGFLPGAGALTKSPVRPGMEREFIEFLKQLYRMM